MHNKKSGDDSSSLGSRIIWAGIAGGMAEIFWISIYSQFSSVSAVNVARQISATVLPVTVDSSYAPLFGILIHLILSLVLAVAFTKTILKPIVMRYGTKGIMLSSFTTLGIVWAVNFLIILPVLNSSFTLLMPATVTLISKLLFGVAMGWMLVKGKQNQII